MTKCKLNANMSTQLIFRIATIDSHRIKTKYIF